MADIPLCEPALGSAEIDAVEDVIRSGWLAHGEKNDAFEDQFAEYVGVEHAISMNSCTSALQLAIECSNITGEVIVPSFTWVASANAIVTAGAEPVFVDIRSDTRNIEPDRVAEAITPETEAIMPVHYGGQSCDMEPLMNIADENDLVIIEDSAETIGGTYDGRRTGSFGIGCFSFYPTKNITTGEGGMLTTDDDELASRIRASVGHGISDTALDRESADESWYRSASYHGYNFRMSNVHAAMGVEQMKRITELNAARRDHAEYLTTALRSVPYVSPPVERDERRHVYQMYSIRIDDTLDRDAVVKKLNDRGIGASVHFSPPVHRQPAFESGRFRRHDLSTTEEVADTIATLPMFPGLSRNDCDDIIEAVETVIRDERE